MNLATANLPDEIRAILISTVADVFTTMFSTEVKPAALHPQESGEVVLAGSVGFIGDVNGVIHIRVDDSFARILASRMLGLAPAELDDDMVNDVVGELSNMIVGSVKSHLCDQGVPCVLTIPSVIRGTELTVEPVQCAERRIVGFRADDHHFHLELFIKNRQ